MFDIIIDGWVIYMVRQYLFNNCSFSSMTKPDPCFKLSVSPVEFKSRIWACLLLVSVWITSESETVIPYSRATSFCTKLLSSNCTETVALCNESRHVLWVRIPQLTVSSDTQYLQQINDMKWFLAGDRHPQIVIMGLMNPLWHKLQYSWFYHQMFCLVLLFYPTQMVYGDM